MIRAYSFSKKVSKLSKGIITILASLAGIKFKKKGKIDYSKLITSAWVFIILTCIGVITIGPAFPISNLLYTLILTVFAVNLENAIEELIKLISYFRKASVHENV